jgi:5-methylcytosine-specific restriction protein A
MNSPGQERGFEIQRTGDDEPDFTHESHSWTVLSDQVAVKRMDKSSFFHHEMAIPVELRPFFNIETMMVGEKRQVVLAHGVIEYSAYFEMLNEKNPRTRLVWRTDLQRLIHEKFPVWATFFQTHTRPGESTPTLKIVKTRSASKYLVFFEYIRKSSETLELLKVYSREELKDKFQITDSIIKNGVSIPKDTSSVWLLITEEKSPDGTGYRYHFDGQILQFEGNTKGATDGLIINHESAGNEIIVFYQKKKREFPNYGFRYLGRFSYLSHTAGKFIGEPAQFIIHPLDVMLDDKGDLVAIEPSPPPGSEGKEKTLIQTYWERRPELRRQAIKIHGKTCTVCGFHFTEKYGNLGEGYIEIHCLKPPASIRGEKDVKPGTDLVPVCSNCHRMIHTSDPMLTVEELKKNIL